MAIIEFTALCPKCDRKLPLLLECNVNPSIPKCPHCGENIVKTIAGYVYVLHNEHMPELTKIGFTTRLVESRLAELNAPTGVPPSFKLYAVFISDNPQSDERKLHNALEPHRIKGSEFFKIDVATATRRCQEVLNRQSYLQNSSSNPRHRSYLSGTTVFWESSANEKRPKRGLTDVGEDARVELCRVFQLDPSSEYIPNSLSNRRRFELENLAKILNVENSGDHADFYCRMERALIAVGVFK